MSEQSDAEPVAWRYKAPGPQDVWALTTDPEIAQVRDEHYGWTVEPLYTAPPRHDVSGLIEAAKRCTAQIINECIWPIDSCEVDDGKITTIIAEAFRSRAADRSGK